MHKIIHKTFEFDLSSYKITVQEDNYWFSDGFTTKYSFPFVFHLDDELKKVFGELLDDNAFFTEKEYGITYVRGNLMEKGVFILESQIDTEITAKFRYGMEEFPNWNKKLADFNFPTINTVSPYIYGYQLITQNTNRLFEYPEIYTEKHNREESTFETFLGVLNNFDKTTDSYLKNDTSSENFTNQNIMHPCLYWVEVLELCLAESGFFAGGDLYFNPIFNQMLLYGHVDFFTRNKLTEQKVFVSYQFDNITTYSETFTLVANKKYKIRGNVLLFKNFQSSSTPNSGASYSISYNGNDLLTTGYSNPRGQLLKNKIETIFETSSDENIAHQITFNATEVNSYDTSSKDYVFDVVITPIVDGAETTPDEIINENEIDLKKALPDITFGQLMTETKRLFNAEIKILDESTLCLNLIDNQMNYENATDLTNFEVKKPEKKFNTRDSFLLKYKDNDEDVVFVNRDGVELDKKNKNSKTETIEITAKLLKFTNLQTSKLMIHAPADLSPQDICIILYDKDQARVNVSNTAVSSNPLLPLNLYNQFYINWFQFLLYSTQYRWFFKMYENNLSSIGKKIHAYTRYHVVKSLEKTEISEDLYEVEIETETLE